jgi:hypothetical protein
MTPSDTDDGLDSARATLAALRERQKAAVAMTATLGLEYERGHVPPDEFAADARKLAVHQARLDNVVAALAVLLETPEG